MLFYESIVSLFLEILKNSLYASFLIITIYFIRLLFKNKLGPKLIYFLWIILFARLLLPFDFNIFKIPRIDSISFIMSRYHNTEAISQSSPAIASAGIFAHLTFLHIAAFLWLVMIVFFAIKKIIVKRIFISKLKNEKEITAKKINSLFDECIHSLKINKNIKLIETELFKSPCAFGMFKYKILIPSNLLNALNTNEIKCIFYHELWHIKNRDFILEAFANFLKIIYWVNPLIAFAFYQMKRDCEYLCDFNSITASGNNFQVYGNTLIKILTSIRNVKLLPHNICGIFSLLAALNNKKHIKRRLHMICNNPKQSRLVSVLSVLTLLTVFALTFTVSSFAKKNQQNNIKFINPVNAPRITAKFGKINDPFTKRKRFHNGIDLAKKTGAPVKSSFNGIVLKADRDSSNKTGYGKYIIIAHANGYTTVYAKLSKIYVKKGQHVQLGDIIGLVGSTGRSTGPHLHFEIRKNNNPVDPETLVDFNSKN